MSGLASCWTKRKADSKLNERTWLMRSTLRKMRWQCCLLQKKNSEESIKIKKTSNLASGVSKMVHKDVSWSPEILRDRQCERIAIPDTFLVRCDDGIETTQESTKNMN
jgi:hypothetical protein